MSSEASCAVLVIDDDPLIAEEACEALALRQCRAFYADNIAKARETIAREKDLSVVVVDYHMPQMNGLEVIETLSSDVARPLAFIMLTGDETQAVAAGAVRARAFDFLNKPVDGRKLIETVRRASQHIASLAAREIQHSQMESNTKAMAQQLDTLSETLARREETLRKMLQSERPGIESVADEIRAPLAPLLNHLKDLRQAIGASGSGASDLVRAVLSDGEHLSAIIDSVLPSVADDEPPHYAPVDLSSILQRLLPAIERLAVQHQIRFKTRLPAHLPFLCADEAKFARALTNISGALIGALSPGDSLVVTNIKEGRELVLTYKITSQQFNVRPFKALAQDLSSTIRNLDEIRGDTLKLVESRIVLHLHNGRVRIDEAGGDQWSVRIFLPLTEEDQPVPPELRLWSM